MGIHHLKLTPRDLLFLRDARPMEASDAGQGANWPRPDQLWNAWMAAFWRQWPERVVGLEGDKHTVNENDRHKDNAFRFGALQTVGPFPCGGETCYFPCPLDLCVQEQKLVPMRLTCGRGSNLPKPLKYAFSSTVLGKERPPQWVDGETYLQYLKGEAMKLPEMAPALFTKERTIGIAIDPETRSTVEHQFYQAEYLRLNSGVSLAAQVSCDLKGKHLAEMQDIVKKFLVESREMILGGQQGVVYAEEPSKFALRLPSLGDCPISETAAGPVFLRWTLLAPAVFPEVQANAEKGVRAQRGGWLPTWVEGETGQVMLRGNSGDVPRRPGEDRKIWRSRCQGEVLTGAKLVAARIDKPIYFSGWKAATTLENAPKQTFAAVPAGSVYVFECDTAKTARSLWRALNATDGQGAVVNRRSGLFGEKGFGLGVCSVLSKPDCQ